MGRFLIQKAILEKGHIQAKWGYFMLMAIFKLKGNFYAEGRYSKNGDIYAKMAILKPKGDIEAKRGC